LSTTISSKATVLIVDDEEAVRDYLRVLLEQAGYSVLALGDGQSALDFLQRLRVDAVLVDLMMPGVDGWEVTRIMRSDARLRTIPIIVFSAAGDAAPPGVAATLLKPSTAEELLATVDRVLAGERRKRPRYPARFDVRANTSGRSILTTTRDVSSGGLSFETADAPQVGERISLIVSLAVNGVAAMEVRVKHVAPARSGWRVGAELMSVQYNAVGYDAELALLAQSTH
jgi:CheY-like chemotaxis protein